MEAASAILKTVTDFLSANQGSIELVGGILWVFIAKIVPSEKSGPIVKILQAGLDGVAAILIGAGNLLKKASELLAHVVKSDGLLGKP
jgi:hypothetical protein